jgi:hypothetical protein
MIVIDEQLLGRGIEDEIRKWYPGTVCFINDLRPNTIIKDEAIPMLLAQEKDPLFVTINVIDFWQRAEASDAFCLVCIALPDSQATFIPTLLRQLLQTDGFQTKNERREKVARITLTQGQYYTRHTRQPQEIPDFP